MMPAIQLDPKVEKFKDRAVGILKEVLSGTVGTLCVCESGIQPIFAVPHHHAAFCVFDDAGELDYVAWFAIDQRVYTFDDLDLLGYLDRLDAGMLQDVLWNIRRVL